MVRVGDMASKIYNIKCIILNVTVGIARQLKKVRRITFVDEGRK